MLKRRLTWYVLGLLLVLLAAGFGWIVAGQQVHVTEEAYGRVQKGMTETEVEAIFGGPAGDHTTGPVTFMGRLDELSMPMDLLELAEGHSKKTWKSDEGQVHVEFDAGGHVAAMHWSWPATKPTFLERLRWRLGL
jgi:hypothetical protein